MDHEDMIENEMEVEIEDEMADGDEYPTADSENTSHELLDFPFSIPGINCLSDKVHRLFRHYEPVPPVRRVEIMLLFI